MPVKPKPGKKRGRPKKAVRSKIDFNAVAKTFKPVIKRILESKGIGRKHSEFRELENELMVTAFVSANHFKKNPIKDISRALERKALGLIRQVKEREKSTTLEAAEKLSVAGELPSFGVMAELQRILSSKDFSSRQKELYLARMQGLSLKKIAKLFGIGYERARQLNLETEKKLKAVLERKQSKIKARQLKVEKIKKKLSEKQKQALRKKAMTAEASGISSLLKHCSYIKSRYSAEDRGLLKKAINLLPQKEADSIKFLYGIGRNIGFKVPKLRARQQKLQKKLKLSRKETRAFMEKIIEKLKENLKKLQ